MKFKPFLFYFCISITLVSCNTNNEPNYSIQPIYGNPNNIQLPPSCNSLTRCINNNSSFIQFISQNDKTGNAKSVIAMMDYISKYQASENECTSTLSVFNSMILESRGKVPVQVNVCN